MTEEHATIEGEVVEEPGTELEPVGSATLFRTDEPDLIIARATGVADALKRVLVDKQLISRIGDKDYVKVEGWTLLGSMLGVVPVIEWTKPVDDGWEARAVAQNLQGQTVGAAEAECLRSERNWKGRDDYALRSMAQTRAVSKALRAPLGFIVTMAGFEATPSDEMPKEGDTAPRPERRRNATAVPVPKSWPDIEALARDCDNPDEAWPLFQAFVRACSYHLYGEADSAALTTAQKKTVAQKAAGAAVWLREHDELTTDGPFRFYLEPVQRQAWASVLDGAALEIPDYTPPEPPHDEDEAAALAAEVFAQPPEKS